MIVHGWLQHAHAYTQHGFSLPRSVAKITDVFDIKQTDRRDVNLATLSCDANKTSYFKRQHMNITSGWTRHAPRRNTEKSEHFSLDI